MLARRQQPVRAPRPERRFNDIGAVPFSYKSPKALKRAWVALAGTQRATGAWRRRKSSELI